MLHLTASMVRLTRSRSYKVSCMVQLVLPMVHDVLELDRAHPRCCSAVQAPVDRANFGHKGVVLRTAWFTELSCVLCCAVLCCAVLCWAVLDCAVLCCSASRSCMLKASQMQHREYFSKEWLSCKHGAPSSCLHHSAYRCVILVLKGGSTTCGHV